MKTKLYTLIITLFTITAFAQNDLKARIEYEEAETTFAAEDYATAVTHLTKAEKLLGKWTPKIGYLLITSLSKTLNYENPDAQQLKTLDKQINQYMQYVGNSKDVDMDKFREINTIEKAINSVIESQPDYKLGSEYYNKKDYKNAMNHFNKAAAKENGQAMRMIAKLYGEGLGVAQSWTEAINWYKKAADKGNVESMYLLGIRHQKGEGVLKNETEAMNWYKKAANKGHIESMYSLGGMYDQGQGVVKDYKEAMNWYRKAADRDHKYAMYEIARSYEGGYGVTKDFAEARKWYEKAGDKSHMSALQAAKLWFYSDMGEELTKDGTKALQWANKSLELAYNDETGGNSWYLIGRITDYMKKYSEAMDAYVRSHNYGNKDAKGWIAKMHEEGLGVEKNKKLAREWRNK